MKRVITEVAIELAFLGDNRVDIPKAEARNEIIKLAEKIITELKLNKNSEDIDEIITTYLKQIERRNE